ncbi:putative potassium channel protein [Nodularia sp. NIES-3585]|nr:putative potassium channel protein [Nodularia sp. NIES-3585]
MTLMKKQNDRLTLVLTSIAVFLLLVGLTTLLLWSEGALGSRKATWEALENAIITLMAEYPDKPQTILGRILQLLLLVFGTFAFGAIVGKISSFFVTRALLQDKAVKYFQDHIIICNWNEKAPAIVRQLLEANLADPRDIIIISASVIEDRGDLEDIDNVYFVQADPTHHATLEKVQAPLAKAVILLADEETEGPDEKNALIALAIKHLEQTPGQEKDIHVIGELVKLDRHRHLKEAGVDEVISARDYSSGIIAQSAMFKKMSVVYQQLLTYSDDTNEFYFIEPGKYPQHFQGKTFPELIKLISEYSASNADNPLLLLGVKRGGEVLLNPKPSYFEKLDRDDSLIVMAFRNVERIV